jgi:hypothetical protein
MLFAKNTGKEETREEARTKPRPPRDENTKER